MSVIHPTKIQFSNEKDVKAFVKKVLDKHKWFWWMPPANGFGKAGIADINAIRAGVFLAVETKFGKNKPTVNQKAWLESIIAESGFGMVVSDQNAHVFLQWMQAFDRAVAATGEGGATADEDGVIMLEALRILTEPLTTSGTGVAPPAVLNS